MIVTLNKQSLELIDKRILLITAVRKKMINAFADSTKYQTIPKWYEFKVKRARREAYKEARDLHDLAILIKFILIFGILGMIYKIP